jgi:hypothetical protein
VCILKTGSVVSRRKVTILPTIALKTKKIIIITEHERIEKDDRFRKKSL